MVNIYLYIGHHFENEHHFELKNIKNEFLDLENPLKHVLHLPILFLSVSRDNIFRLVKFLQVRGLPYVLNMAGGRQKTSLKKPLLALTEMCPVTEIY